MPSRTYLLFERAMRERRPLVCLYDGYPRAGSSHRTSQTCVRDVDLDVNPGSPFDPRRKLHLL